MSEEFAGNGIVGLAEAGAELDRLIAAESGTTGQQDHGTTDQNGKAGKADDSAETDAQRAGQAADDKAQDDKDDKSKADSGTTGQQDQGTTDQNGKGGDAKAGEKAGDKQSRYAKAQQRLQGGWEELNAGKTAIKAEQDAWQKQRDAEKAELQRQREEFESQRSKAEGEFTPDQYDAAAKKFEREGKLDLADLAKAKAEQLRKNPPAKAGDRQEVARKDWALKAGRDFPELAKDNSPLQVRVAQLMNEEADFKSHPKGIYVAARIASLEAQAAESKALKESVTAKDKELESLKQKVGELEKLTAPGGGNGTTRLPAAKSFEQMSPDEQLADLHRTAAELGSIR